MLRAPDALKVSEEDMVVRMNDGGHEPAELLDFGRGEG